MSVTATEGVGPCHVGARRRTVVACIAAGLPLMAAAALNSLEMRAAALLAHTPRAWFDDPKDVASTDPLAGILYLTTCVLLLGSALSPVLAVVLISATGKGDRRLNPTLWGLAVLAYLVGMWWLSSGSGLLWLLD